MNKCELVSDLLPAYIDEVISPSGREVVEEHLAECAACSDTLAQMKASLSEEREISAAENSKAKNPFKKIKVKKLVITTLCVILSAAVLLYGAFLADGYINYGYDGLTERLGINVLALAKDKMLRSAAEKINAGNITEFTEQGGSGTRSQEDSLFVYKDKWYDARCAYTVDGIGSVSLTYFELYEINPDDGYHVFDDGTLLVYSGKDLDFSAGYTWAMKAGDDFYEEFGTDMYFYEAYQILYFDENERIARFEQKRRNYNDNGMANVSDDAIQMECDEYFRRRDAELESVILSIRQSGVSESAIEEWKSK